MPDRSEYLDADGLVVASGVVRSNHFVATVQVGQSAPSCGSVALLINGVQKCEVPVPISGQSVTLTAPVEIVDGQSPDVAVYYVSENSLTLVQSGSGDFLPRLNIKNVRDFNFHIARRSLRIKDRETLIAAAKIAFARFNKDIPTRAASLAVIGYQYVEDPTAAARCEIDRFIVSARNFSDNLNLDSMEGARWAPSVEYMLYQLFLSLKQFQDGADRLSYIYKIRDVVELGVTNSLNLINAVLVLGYLYQISGRLTEAAHVWSGWHKILLTAVSKYDHTLPLMREIGVIYEKSMICLTCTKVLCESDPDEPAQVDDKIIAQLTLRTNDARLRKCARDFFDEVRRGNVSLPVVGAGGS